MTAKMSATTNDADGGDVGVVSVESSITVGDVCGSKYVIQTFVIFPSERMRPYLEYRTVLARRLEKEISEKMEIIPLVLGSSASYEKTVKHDIHCLSRYYRINDDIYSKIKGFHRDKIRCRFEVNLSGVINADDIGKCEYCEAFFRIPGGRKKCLLGRKKIFSRFDREKVCGFWEERSGYG